MAETLEQIDAQLVELLGERVRCLAEGGGGSVCREAPMVGRLEALGVPRALWKWVELGTAAGATRRGRAALGQRPRRVTVVGGRGGMGSLFGGVLRRAGHEVAVLDSGDWDRAEELLGDAEAVVVSVPIEATEEVVRRVGEHLREDALLADLTSVKTPAVRAMLAAHAGAVVGLHPMFGPDVEGLNAQRIVVCAGRKADEAAWLLELFKSEGATLVEATAKEHDRMMVTVQAIRHFCTFGLGVFLAEEGVDVSRSLDFASPIYRLEIDVVSRLFAQDASLYLNIMSASDERRASIGRLAQTFARLAASFGEGDLTSLDDAFERTTKHLGAEAPRAMRESALAVEALSMAAAGGRE